MEKVDLKRQLRPLYSPPRGEVVAVDVPPLSYLMVDGVGNPNTAAAYRQAVEALFSVAYGLKFLIKKGALAVDYGVMPLEGLWWVDDMAQFSVERKDDWQWIAMILQPAYVTPDLFEQAREQAARRKDLPALPLLRLATFHEGRAAQVLHVGPYAAEAPTIARLHAYIERQGGQLQGKHHEIYLSDPARSAPERLQTIIRQPFG